MEGPGSQPGPFFVILFLNYHFSIGHKAKALNWTIPIQSFFGLNNHRRGCWIQLWEKPEHRIKTYLLDFKLVAILLLS
jgi:hypothetical protein